MLATFKTFFKQFISESKGQIGIMFAMLLVPLLIITGGVLDYGLQYNNQRKLQSAIDMANLALAKEIAQDKRVKDSRLRKIASVILGTNAGDFKGANLQPFKITRGGGEVKLSQKGQIKTNFLRLIGIDNMKVVAKSTASFDGGLVEVALALDMSGSMKGQKLADLKIASESLVSILLPRNNATSNRRIALVPWASGVYVGEYGSKILEGKRKCAKGRLNYYRDVSGMQKKLFPAKQCYKRAIIPLTNIKTTLKAQINSWFAKGRTNSSSGLALSWAVLSPKWQNVWGTKGRPSEYSDAKKYVILMTDGANNKKSQDVETINLCKAMKQKNIRIYAISYGAKKRAEDLLKECVTKPEMYINATNSEILIKAFRDIANEIGNIHLSG